MQTYVTSAFTTFYLVRAIAAGIIIIGVPCFLVLICIQRADDSNTSDRVYLLLACAVFAFFSARQLIYSCKSVTITPGDIIVQWYITRKKRTYLLNEIVSTTTTRPSADWTKSGYVRYQTFNIELRNGTVISINEGDYANYHEIKSCVYDNRRKGPART